MENLNEYELEILKRLENKFSTDPEEKSPFKHYHLLQKKKIFGTHVISYYNERLHHDIFPIPEVYKDSYLLLYSEKNRYEFLLHALMTFWQKDIDNLISILIQREIEILGKTIKDQILLEKFIQNYSKYLNFDTSLSNLEEELYTFGISLIHDFIEVSYSWHSPAYFINKLLFYKILLFYFESLELSKHLDHLDFIAKNLAIIKDWIQIIQNQN